VESARRYECRSVQSAQEYMMYLDTDAQSSEVNVRGFDCELMYLGFILIRCVTSLAGLV